MKNNFDYLIEQYKHAKGIKNADIYSKGFIKDFNLWLNQKKIMGTEFLSYLDFLDLNYKKSNCAEVGKGEHDTIVKPFDTKILSSFTNDITNVNKDRFMIGNLKIHEGNASLLINHKLNIIPNSIVNTYLIHNPYSFNSLHGIEDIHNNNSANIIIGVYGNTTDKDYAKKTEMLDSIKDKLVGNYISEYDTSDEAYYYILASKNKVKLK